jgi:hypothetical protein
VNNDDGGGKKSGSGRSTQTGKPAAHKGGELGGGAFRLGEEGGGNTQAQCRASRPPIGAESTGTVVP